MTQRQARCPHIIVLAVSMALACGGRAAPPSDGPASTELPGGPPSETAAAPPPPDASPSTSRPPSDATPPVTAPSSIPASGPFRLDLEPGIAFAAHEAPDPRPDVALAPADALGSTDRRLFVLTIDPARYEVVLASVRDPANDGSARTAEAWARDLNLSVAWNPGMFEPDGASTGYTRTPAFTSQERVRRAPLYSSFFVASDHKIDVLHERPPTSPDAYVDLDALSPAFVARLRAHTFVAQSLTVLRDGRAAYPATGKQWSELAYGVDDRGHLAVVFTRYPYELRDFGQRLEGLGIGLRHLIHGEGGPEATLVVRAGGVNFVGVGSYETGFWGAGNDDAWRLPAVMGVRPRRP